MTSPTIPAEAIEAAIRTMPEYTPEDEADSFERETNEQCRAKVERILEAAAPHMLPRTITPEEQLDALPVGSIVAMIGSEPDSPAVACRAVRGWQFLGDDPERRYLSSSLMPTTEPITVLHEPTP